MNINIVFPLDYFQTAMTELAERPSSFVRRPFGLNYPPEIVELLVRESAHLTPNSNVLALTTADSRLSAADLERLLSESQADALLAIGGGENIGKIWGLAKTSRLKVAATAGIETVSIDKVRLVGAEPAELRTFRQTEKNADRPLEMIPVVYERYSRTIGAVGYRHWKKITGLRVAVIGCGRTGSLTAIMLARMGVKNLTLIDPDNVETHNLGEMEGINESSLGQPKAVVLADFLRLLFGSKRKTKDWENSFLEQLLQNNPEIAVT